MMNRTVMIIFIPIAILACKAMGANPIGIIILVQAACLSSFMTPMATPAIPMCMASGGYDLKSLLKQSLLPAMILCVVSVFWIMTVFPLY
jgi:di/tricarboxylate transporter